MRNTSPSNWQTRRFPHPTLKDPGGCCCRLSPRRRVFRYREGDFVRGGRFCTPLQATTGTTPTIPPSRNISTLQRRLRSPEWLERPATGSPKQRRRVICHPERGRVLSPPFSAPEGIPVPGGRFCPGRAILHALTSSSRHNADTSTLPQHFHPPATFSPSGADSGTAGFKDPVQQKARGRGGGAGRERRKGARAMKGGTRAMRGGARVGGERERDEDEGGRRGSGVAANQPRAAERLRDTVRYPDGENFPNFTQFWRNFVE